MNERYPKHSYRIGIRHERHDVSLVIKTSLAGLSLDDRGTVMRIVRLTHTDTSRTLNYNAIPPEAIYAVRPCDGVVTEAMTVGILHDDGDVRFLYYVWPDDGVRVTLNRVDRNAEDMVTYTNTFIVPSRIYNHDCTGDAVKALMAQAAYEYAEMRAEANGTDMPDAVTWDDVVNVPNDFLALYGLHQFEEPATLLTLTVDADGELPGPGLGESEHEGG